MEKYRVVFAPSQKEIIIEENRTLLDAAREAGVYIDSQCNGKGKCGKCRIRVVEGQTTPLTPREAEFIGHSDRELGYRLACMTRITGDVTLLVSGENILTPAAAKKVFSKRSTILNPAVKSYVTGITKKTDSGKIVRKDITEPLLEQHGVGNLTISDECLKEIENNIKGEKTITVFV